MTNKAGYLRDIHLGAEWLTSDVPADHESAGETMESIASTLAIDYGVSYVMAVQHLSLACARFEGHSDNPRENGY